MAVPQRESVDLDVAHPSVGTLVKEASTHFSTLLRSEIELAKTEVKTEVKKGVAGSGMLAAAGVIVAVALPFLFVALAELLTDPIGLARWLSYLIVFVLFLLVAGVLAMVGIRKVKKIRAPERTISSMKANKALVDAVTGDDSAATAPRHRRR